MIPAILPVKLVVRSLLEDFKSIGRTVWMEPTMDSFFCVPNATTVASSKFSEVGFICTFIVVRPFTSTCSSLYPINVTRKTPSGRIVRV